MGAIVERDCTPRILSILMIAGVVLDGCIERIETVVMTGSTVDLVSSKYAVLQMQAERLVRGATHNIPSITGIVKLLFVNYAFINWSDAFVEMGMSAPVEINVILVAFDGDSQRCIQTRPGVKDTTYKIGSNASVQFLQMDDAALR